MLWRTYLLNRLVWPRDIKFIIWRHPIVYVKVLIQYIAVLILLFFLRKLLWMWLHKDVLQLWFGIAVGVFYSIGVFMILRQYFDIIVPTEDNLYIVLRDSFFSYRIKIITWHSVQDVSVVPASWLSVLWKDSHISIATEQDDRIDFHHVYEADRIVQKMYHLRDNKIYNTMDDDQEEIQPKDSIADETKFKVLVETLGEVIVDYMKKKEE